MDLELSSVLDKLPLAECTWLLWDKILPDPVLNQFYDTHRGRSYERAFSFADLVYLVNDTLCRHQGRARRTLDQNRSTDHCPATEQAFYGKLRRVPVGLSEAFLADASDRLRTWLPGRPYIETPDSLEEFRILLMDGKTFKHAAKRLKAARTKAGRGLGGKALVAFEPATGLIVGMAADPHAHTNEAKLVPDLLPGIRQRLSGPILWVADQGFGDLAQVRRCTAAGDHCVLRLHPKSQFVPDPKKPTRHGTDASGRVWEEQIGELRSNREGTMTVRLITLYRPDDEPLRIVTDLLDMERYPANDLLALYKQRWGIEHVFQRVSEVFHLKHLIGSSPRAIIFQAALCMILYNLLQVVRGIVAETQKRPTATVSTSQLFFDLTEQLKTVHCLFPPDQVVEGLQARAATIGDLRAYLYRRLGGAWKPLWAKCPPKERHTKKVKHKRGQAGHFSIHKAMIDDKKSRNRIKQTAGKDV
jgi:Transposase DDE domain